jgi:hypothetical protein
MTHRHFQFTVTLDISPSLKTKMHHIPGCLATTHSFPTRYSDRAKSTPSDFLKVLRSPRHKLSIGDTRTIGDITSIHSHDYISRVTHPTEFESVTRTAQESHPDLLGIHTASAQSHT